MLPRLFIAILFSLVVTAQDAPPQTPEQSLRRIIRQSEQLTSEEKSALMSQVRQYPDQCVLSAALFPQADQSRLLVGIAASMDEKQKNQINRKTTQTERKKQNN